MTPADESFAQFFGIDPKHRDVLVHWCNDVLLGVELSLFGGLLFQTDATADSIASSFPQNLDELPWRGSEQRLAEVLVADLRQRGQSDEQIAEIAQTLAVILTQVRRCVEPPPAPSNTDHTRAPGLLVEAFHAMRNTDVN